MITIVVSANTPLPNTTIIANTSPTTVILGNIQGISTPTPIVKPFGSSAYQVAVANGFIGTEANWLISLRGTIGLTGPTGPIGIQGTIGLTGITDPRVQSLVSATNVTPNIVLYDTVDITALTQNIIFNNTIDTPINFQKLIIRIKDVGISKSISWGTAYANGGIVLPSTTTPLKILTLGFMYNTGISKWQLVGLSLEI